MTEPRVKSRARFWVRDLRVLTDSQRARYSPAQIKKGFKVNTYNTAGGPEAVFRKCVLDLYAGRSPYTGPVRIEGLFAMPRPKRLAKQRARVYHQSTPDIDNLLKLVDALNTTKRLGPGLWLDDKQIMAVSAAKAYAEPGDPPHLEVGVYGLKQLLDTAA